MTPLLALALLAAAGQAPRVAAATAKAETAQPGAVVKRAAMQAVEKAFDRRLEATNPADPFDLLGDTRGIYLPGFGVVLTAEVDLIKVPGISPFHQAITAEERPRLHARKLEAVPRLKEAMKAVLLSCAADLRSVPPNENIVVAVTLFYFVGEDATGLPAQLIVQAPRQQLLTNPAADSIKVQEF